MRDAMSFKSVTQKTVAVALIAMMALSAVCVISDDSSADSSYSVTDGR